MRYLDGELSGEDSLRLEQELRENPVLQERLERLRAAQRSVRLFALKEQVKAVHHEMMPQYRQPAPVIRMRRMAMRVAAAVVVLLSVAVFYEYRQLTPASLYKENFTPYIEPTVRGGNDSSASGTIRGYFLAGNAYLNTGDAVHAIRAFDSVRAKNGRDHTHILEDDTDYYLAMSYLKNNELGPALLLFDKIHDNPSHLYHDKVGGWWLRKLHWAR